MKSNSQSNKVKVASLIAGSILLLSLGTAVAHQNNATHGGGYGIGHVAAEVDDKTIELRKKFHEETTDLRKKMFTTHAEMKALMSGDSPDSKEAGRLAAELFETKEQLRKKAEELGIDSMGHGMGFGGQMMGGMMGGKMGGHHNLSCNGQGPHNM